MRLGLWNQIPAVSFRHWSLIWIEGRLEKKALQTSLCVWCVCMCMHAWCMCTLCIVYVLYIYVNMCVCVWCTPACTCVCVLCLFVLYVWYICGVWLCAHVYMVCRTGWVWVLLHILSLQQSLIEPGPHRLSQPGWLIFTSLVLGFQICVAVPNFVWRLRLWVCTLAWQILYQ